MLKQKIRLWFEDLSSDDRTLQFEKEVQTYFKRDYCVTTSSYRMGLYYTLISLKLEKGDEVILTSITIPDTINAILILGLKPIFVDLDLDTHAMDPNKIEEKIGDRTRVLLVTYLSGMVPDVERYKKICQEKKLTFIEDFSQNYVANSNGVPCGSSADISIGSLSCGKILSTLTGGIVLTNNEKIFKEIKKLSDELQKAPEKTVLNYYLNNCLVVTIATVRFVFNVFVFNILKIASWTTQSGIVDFEHEPNHKNNLFYTFIPIRRKEFPPRFHTWMSGWQADMGLFLIKRMEKGTKERRELIKVLINHLSPESRAMVPKKLFNISECSYYHFPIYCFGKKNKLRKFLFENGIDSGSYGLNINHLEQCFDFYDVGDLKNTETIKYDTLFIPINEKYNKNSMIHIANILNEFNKLKEII